MKAYSKLTILGVCAAQGALLHPLRKAKILANIEPRAVFHTKGEEQWKLNFSDIPFVRSLEQLPDQLISPDIIVGSPSCGHSSVFSYSRKKTLGNPKEEKTLSLFINSVLIYKPSIFLMENLPKLLDLIPLEEWKAQFKEYKLIPLCHSVSDFGNSQVSRKRLVLIGVKNSLNSSLFKQIFPVKHLFKVKFISKMINSSLNFRESLDKKMAMYDYRDKTKSTLTVKRIHELWNADFKNEFKWPMKGTKMNTLPGVYRNRNNAYPLTARPSSRQFNPDGWPMGLEEYRVIMGFPKTFKVYFDHNNETYWLNKGRNTLTKGSVYEVGVWFRKILKKLYKTK